MRIQTVPSLFVILLFCVYLCSHIFVASGLCLNDQRSLLLQLKSNFNYSQLEYSRKLVSWNQSIACCEWSRVTCDDEGHVIGLDLSEEYIYGGLHNSSSIFSLQHLQNLNLAFNDFESVIPFGFNKLENLTYLNLSYAGFVGQVPIDISHMKRLVTLDISGVFAELKLEKPNLRDLVINLINIRRLYLDGVNISAKGEEWNAALLQIPSLQELSMSDCNISGPLESFPTRLENLSVIRLDGNNFSSPVPETFANLKNLTTLSLNDCGLTGMFPQKIFQVPTLSFIDISYNEDVNGFFPDFPLNAYLHILSVFKTNFSGPLPNSIGNLRNLSALYLSGSQFNGTLPNALSNLTQLEELDLSSNRFGGLIPSFTLCKNLVRLSLSNNHLTGDIPSTHFEGLANLVEIDLGNNSFTGKIPSSIFTLPSLQSVLLFENKFGQLNEFGHVSTGIQYLDLSDNRLEGHIPISLFQLRQLVELSLSSNKFSGTIDFNMISKLQNLTELDLSNNNLSFIDTTTSKSNFALFPRLISVSLASCNLTTFPQFLKNQSGLMDLDLSNNHIAGIVPKWFANHKDLNLFNLSYNYLTHWEEPLLLNNMSNLYVLDVNSNHLQGPLLALPPKVAYLDYSSNNLSSFIPPNIGNYLFESRFLSFSSNNLNGNIPESICKAPYLEVLDLSNNVLTGTIPKCLIAMNGTLAVLDLARNKLNGTIDTFPGTCNLRSLHLNDNSLQGKIPKYLANCAMLQVFDLGNNQVHDQFPCWLKSISTLRVLVLRSNKLHGSLKCQVAWPHLQIIDLASNNFSGRIPLSFFESWKAMMNDDLVADYLQFHPLPVVQNYYHDTVTVTSKQQQMHLVRILTIFTAVDLSCNKFEGLIPEVLGQLNALYVLNLSHNVFSGHIPSSRGNLKKLESLDLSSNKLIGEIPAQLASLSFLEVLNLSNNHLEGRIPTGTQIQSFEAASFQGNDGLCGPPLTQNCSGDGEQGASPPASSSNTDKESSIDWNFLSIELGVTFGIGIIVLPLIFCKSWRIWYWEHVDNMLYRVFPMLDFVYEYRGGRGYRTLRWKRY